MEDNNLKIDVWMFKVWFDECMLVSNLKNIVDYDNIKTTEKCRKALSEVNRIKDSVLVEEHMDGDTKICITNVIIDLINDLRNKLFELESNDNGKAKEWFPVNKTFLVELEFDVENEDTANMLLDSFFKKQYLLPNLYVKKFYSKDEIDNVVSLENKIKLEQLKDKWKEMLENIDAEINNFLDKEIYKID